MKTVRERRSELRLLAKKIESFIKREGSGPTVRQVAEMYNGGTSSSHGVYLLNLLVKYGYIKRGKGFRSVQVIEKAIQ